MDFLLVFMRLLHIVLGVFWVGTMLFNVFFLGPAMEDAGPDGAKVAAGLMQRRFFAILPIAALLTVLSGGWLYWRASLGFEPAYMRSGPGMTYGTGALAAVIAFIIGAAVVRPAMMKAFALGQRVGASAPEARGALLAEAQALRVRAAQMSRLVAFLLIIAAAAMAIGRYV